MSAAQPSIPYERQTDAETNRTCGAACLSMVYRSFGKQVPQEQIWAAIAKVNRFGSLASTTHLMAQDALNRGFAAVAIQARHPLQALRLCREFGARAILNHRPAKEAPTGHYSVLVDIDDKAVVLHDPFYGPSRRLAHAELLELWLPHYANSEIIGNALIAIAATESPAVVACEFCHTPIPVAVDCPACKKPVGLKPRVLLGCLADTCIARMWNYICCPACDYTWTFRPQQEGAGAGVASGVSASPAATAGAAPGPKEDPWKLEHLFGVLDKFCNHLQSVPAAANLPGMKENLAYLVASKEKLKMAQAEAFVIRKAHDEKMAAFEQAAKQKAEAHRKRMEELNTPLAPLDGNALGRALLKNLGFTR